jgi:hypothetical protein
MRDFHAECVKFALHAVRTGWAQSREGCLSSKCRQNDPSIKVLAKEADLW